MTQAAVKRILVVDDEEGILVFLRQLLESSGWAVSVASSGAAGIEKLEAERFDVVLTDLKMPGGDGLEVLRTAKKLQPEAEVLLMTGFGTVDTAVEAMRLGAFHYLLKPFRPTEALHLVDKAYAQRQLTRENLFLRGEARGEHQLRFVVGTSPAIQEAVAAAQRAAEEETPVLFEGESGTGRELFAKIVHYRSARSANLFVPVPCGAAPEDVLESDLFGHAPGAYEHATLQRVGKIELANHGTLFLSDLDRASRKIQEKILRLLDTRTICPVGSDDEVEVDVRLLASCPPDPETLVRTGAFLGRLLDAFRRDTVRLPPLRERREDIPLLLSEHLFAANRKRKKPLSGFSEAAVATLAAYSWPGNIRELTDLVAAVSARKKQGTVVSTADLPSEILYGHRWKEGASEAAAAPHPGIRRAIEDTEKSMLQQALALAEGDREKAADLLRIDTEGLLALIRKHAIE